MMVPMKCGRWLVWACCGWLLMAGCGPAGSGKPAARVTGTVTLNGQPLESGMINFLPAEKDQAPPDSAPIIGGKYTIPASPIGKVRVMFVATKKTGKMIPGSSAPVEEELSLIQGKNAAGHEVTISASGGEQNFALTDP